MQENDLFDIFPEFSKVVHILAVIPAISCSAERSFRASRRMKINENLPPQHHGATTCQQHCTY